MVTPDVSLLDQLNHCIQQHLDDPVWSAEELARSLSMSRSQLFRLVKDQTGLSPALYIRHQRLSMARHLLETTDLRINEVGDRVGISSPQNFSKYFTEQFGVSPSALRRGQSELVADTSPGTDSAPTEGVTNPNQHETTATEIITSTNETSVQPTTLSQLVLPARHGWRARSRLIAVLVLAGVGGAALIWFFSYQYATSRQPSLSQRSIAVLPFNNRGPAETGPLAEGITDDLHTVLSLADSLNVIARTSSDQYQSTKKTIWQIGDELQVANLLKGSVLKTGNRLQIRLELIRTQDDIRLWTKTYSGDYNDLFRLTDQMGREVVQQLNPPTGRPARPIARPVPTTSLAAYNAFLQGRQLMLTRSEDKLRAGIARFDEAIGLDARYADAYAYRAVCHQLLIDMGYQTGQATWNEGQQNALTAIRLDSTNSTAYATLGSLYTNAYQWQQAETAFRMALRHNPNDAQANYWYSLLLRAVGRLDEALAHSTKARALDPLYPVMLGGHVFNCAYAGRFDLADQTLADGKLLFGDSFLYAFAEAINALARDDYAGAATAYRRVLQLNPDLTSQYPSLFYCEARLGQPAHARAYLTTTPETPRIAYNKAVVCAGLGDGTNCLRYLKKAADGGFIYRDLLVFPPFRPYVRDPAFRAILRQYGLPESR